MQLNYWKRSWPLMVDRCPCDVHLLLISGDLPDEEEERFWGDDCIPVRAMQVKLEPYALKYVAEDLLEITG